jgi:hypothetical protein
MKKKSRRVFRHPKGAFVTDEMDFVSAPRQVFTER